jgi:hypothetical protein
VSARKPGALPITYGAYRAVVVAVTMVLLLGLAYLLITQGPALWERVLLIIQGFGDTWTEWDWSLF